MVTGAFVWEEVQLRERVTTPMSAETGLGKLSEQRGPTRESSHSGPSPIDPHKEQLAGRVRHGAWHFVVVLVG